MATWSQQNCLSFKTAARGFEPGFSQLRVWRSNHIATTLHRNREITTGIEEGYCMFGRQEVIIQQVNTGGTDAEWQQIDVVQLLLKADV